MKRVFALFMALFLLMGTLVMVTGCGDGGSRDPALVGEWVWEDDFEFIYVFEESGSGHRGFPGHETAFVWTASNGSLDFRFRNTSTAYARRWRYTINGDVMILESQETDEIFTYIRWNQYE